MLKIGILEAEETAKNILYELGDLLQDEDWGFQCFTKLAQLAKVQEHKTFKMLIMQSKFYNERVVGSFITPYPDRLVIFTYHDVSEIKDDPRVVWLNRHQLKAQLKSYLPYIMQRIKSEEEYLFSYNHVSVPLKISDIYYIEKDNKNLIYHTKRGEFVERKSIKEAESYFEAYRFIRIHSSFLVNAQYISKVESETLYLGKISLPIARLRKQEVLEKLKKI